VSGTAGRLSALAEELAAIQQAKASGDHAELERLKVEFLAGTLRNADAARLQAAGVAPPPGESDPVERLSTLADLHQRGELTDAEFACAKAKIVGQD
jgi:hypothetical protein